MALVVKELLKTKPDGKKIKISGWVRTKRDTKNVCFFELSDGSCLKNLQVIIDKTIHNLDDSINRMTTGSSAAVEGVLTESPGKNQTVELQAENLEIIGESPADSYPLQKKRHSFEFLREIAHLRPRTNTFGAIARVRSAMSYAIHSYFRERGFLYVHTPIISSVDAEGAGDMFQVTTVPVEKLASSGKGVDFSRDFFGKKTYLAVSGQLQVENYACALSNVYTFGPTFRAENSNTSRHLAEFWMIEPEMAFCDINGNMDTAEEFIKYIFKYILDNCAEDMEFFNKWVQKGIIDTIEGVVSSEFTRVTYSDAVNLLEKADANFEFPVKWGIDLQAEHERYLTETVFKKPAIVTDYPKEIKAFYMKLNEDGKTVRAMDVLVPRLGEIIGGSERESDYDVLKNRMEQCGLDTDDYWWYLDLRKYGTVPHSGFGLGFERIIQYVTGMQNIRDVIPFPRTPRSADF